MRPTDPTAPQHTTPQNKQLFLDAHLLTHRANRVAVLAATPDRSDFLYPDTPRPETPAEGAATAAVVDRVGQAVVEGLRRLVGGKDEEEQARSHGRRQGSLVAQALSKGLCCECWSGFDGGLARVDARRVADPIICTYISTDIQRALREQAPLSARLLVLQVAL